MTDASMIIGGGVAGATAALALARAGRRVDLYERSSSASHKICGEFLSREVSANLRALGADPADLGARPITRVRLVRGARSVDEPLPFPALALSRKALDEALLEHAADSGVNVIRGKTARRIEQSDDGGFIVSFGSEGVAPTRTIFLATGKHDLRGVKRAASGRQSDYLALKMYYRFNRKKTEHLRWVTELILLRECYLGLMLVEDDHVNFCFVISEGRFAEAGGTWDGVLKQFSRESDYVADYLDGAEPLLDRPLAISRIPYGFVHSPSLNDPQGLWRLGDQIAVIPSFTGDGMGMASCSAVLAANMFLEGATSHDFHRRFSRIVRRQMRLSTPLNGLFFRHSAGQDAIIWLASLFPSSVRVIASLTRVPEAAIRRIT
ncbi:MAG: NAD(P)/FAD-dependent oxidoreductase [Methylocystis sp.]|uniref:NAD(P)/FAD-dependent oxidoreductase n=1 Tax=Methylocystis sp. TaxID=1911079 RepID=UPI003D0F233F